MKQVVYMYVTRDKYELPLIVSDDPEEVGQYCGRTKQSVYEGAWRYEHGGKSRYRRVTIDV